MTTLQVADCEVIIGRGLPQVISEAATVAVLHQPGVPARVAASIADKAANAHLIEIPDGEAAKTLEVAGGIYRRLNDIGLTRADAVVGVGGGAATDLAGFVAATYLRGVAAIYVPTTLLGAVDASVGGKTGVNVEGKNLVGVFAHPARVLIDVDVLEEAPEDVMRQGHAEAVNAMLENRQGVYQGR